MGWNANQIVSSGENEKGKWIKFPDGTLVQYGKSQQLDLPPDTYNGPLVSLPIAFIDTNYSVQAVCGEYGTFGGAVVSTYESFPRYEDAFFVRYFYNYSTTLAIGCTFTAIGRWKE